MNKIEKNKLQLLINEEIELFYCRNKNNYKVKVNYISIDESIIAKLKRFIAPKEDGTIVDFALPVKPRSQGELRRLEREREQRRRTIAPATRFSQTAEGKKEILSLKFYLNDENLRKKVFSKLNARYKDMIEPLMSFFTGVVNKDEDALKNFYEDLDSFFKDENLAGYFDDNKKDQRPLGFESLLRLQNFLTKLENKQTGIGLDPKYRIKINEILEKLQKEKQLKESIKLIFLRSFKGI